MDRCGPLDGHVLPAVDVSATHPAEAVKRKSKDSLPAEGTLVYLGTSLTPAGRASTRMLSGPMNAMRPISVEGMR